MMSLPERTSQPRCDPRPDKFQPQNHVAGDHAPLFVVPCDIPLSVRLAAKVLSGRKELQKSPCGESPFRQKGPTEIA